MADHEDYLPGEAPAAHSATHEDGGADEINLLGLDGQSNELLAHSLIPTAHQDAPAMIALHAAIEDAHHVRYTDAEVTAIADGLIDVHTAIVDAHHLRYTDAEAEAVADTQIATHTAIPTAHQDAPALILAHKGDPVAHQDAPALILAHKGDASAHHAKYTDAEARALLSPVSIPPPAFVPFLDNQDFEIRQEFLKNRAVLVVQYFVAPVIFPDGVTVTKLTLYGYRDDVDAVLALGLNRVHRLGGSNLMASVTSNWTTGWSSFYDDTINNSIINNGIYSYALVLTLNPNDAVADVKFSGAKIEFTG